jgi:hypothetical protein
MVLFRRNTARGRRRPVMVRKHWYRPCRIIRNAAILFSLVFAGMARAADTLPTERAASARVFPTSRYAIDEILTRPFDRDVPTGCTGARVWASSRQGWAFGDDVHWLDFTSVTAFDIEIRDQDGLLEPATSTYYPSHIHSY